MMKFLRILGNIIRWLFALLCILFVPIFGLNIGTIILLITSILALPLKPIQRLWQILHISKGWIKLLLVVILFFGGVLSTPTPVSTNISADPNVVSPAPSTISTEVPTAEPTVSPTIEPTATPTIEPTATPTVEPTATPTVKPTATPTVKPTATPTVKPTATPTVKPTAAPTVKPTATPVSVEENIETYVLNTNTNKFHEVFCSSVDTIKAHNRVDFTGTRDEVIAKGYEPCGRCKP